MDGFTGRYVQSELEEHNHSIIGLSSDLTDFKAVEDELAQVQPEAVIHLAAMAFVEHDDINSFYHVNLIGTRNLLHAISKSTPKIHSVLLASSANIYGNRSEGILNESSLPAPINDYAVSKLAMELMAQLWMDKLPICIVRPFNYTGVGQDEKFLIPKIISHFKEKKPIIQLGNLDVWREFGDVRIVANIYRKLIENSPRGTTLNVCTEKPHSLRSIISLCEKITDHQIEIVVNPQFVRDNEVLKLYGNNRKLKKTISDWPKDNLEETLRWMLS